MNLLRAGALTIAAGASLALFPSLASAHTLTADCTQVSAADFPADTHSRVIVDVAVNGHGVSGVAAYEIDGAGVAPLLVPFREPVFQGDSVEVYASSVSSDGFEIPRTLLLRTAGCGGARPTPTLPGTGAAVVEPLPALVSVPLRGKATKPQRPRPKALKCSTRWKHAPRRVATYLAPDGWHHPLYANRGRINCGHEPAVTGERKAQGPSPAAIVSSLLASVPQLAQDVPSASSIQQSAGGRSASGGVSGAERGRLVPLGIPGHPWTSRSTAPHRGVAVSVAWRSGRLTVSVLYSASRGRSTTTVSAR